MSSSESEADMVNQIIDQADQENKWSINFAEVIQIWRNGCIIRADYIAGMLEEIFGKPGEVDRDLLHNDRIAKELQENFPVRLPLSSTPPPSQLGTSSRT